MSRHPSTSGGGGGGPASTQPASSLPTSSLGPSRVDVVVLCGSAGSRLFPLTASPGSPKCLLPLANQPVLAYLLASLAKLGFETVHLATTSEFQTPLQEFLKIYQGLQPKHVHLFVAPSDCGGTAEVLQAMRSGGQHHAGSEDKIGAAASGGSDAPISLRGENLVVVPGECVVESQLLDLLDLHQLQGSDFTMLLTKVSQLGADAHAAGDQSGSGGGGGSGGGKAGAGAKAAKAKAAGGAKKPKRDPEDVEYVGLCSLTDSANSRNLSNSSSSKSVCTGQRLMLKVPALAVEEDLEVPKTLLARAALLGYGGGSLQLRTDLNDPHVYVFSKWALSLLDASKPGRLVSLKNDVVPYLLARQFRDPNPNSSSSSVPSKKGKTAAAAAAVVSVLPQGFAARDYRAERAIAALSSGDSSARARAGLLPNAPALFNATASNGASGEGVGSAQGTSTAPPVSRTITPEASNDGTGSWSENPQSGERGSSGAVAVAVRETCRCLALVCPASAPSAAGSRFLCRLTTVPQYLEANRLVIAWENSNAAAASSSLGKGAAPWGKLEGLRNQRGSLSVVAAGKAEGSVDAKTEGKVDGKIEGQPEGKNEGQLEGKNEGAVKGAMLEAKVQTIRAVVGAGCKVGAQAKLTDCVIMAGATIGAGAVVEGSVVCSGATVGDGAVLKNCQVAAGFVVPGGTKGVDESFNVRPGAEGDSDGSGDDGDGSDDDAFDQMPSAPEDP